MQRPLSARGRVSASAGACGSSRRPVGGRRVRAAPEDSARAPEPPSAAVEKLERQVASLKGENARLLKQIALLKAHVGRTTPAPGGDNGAQQVETAAPAEDEGSPTEDDEEQSASLEAGIVWPDPGSRFWESRPRSEPLTLGGSTDAGEAPPQDGYCINVVHMTAELAPYAKVGGLGDVVQGLAKAVKERGHNVQVMLPYYTCLPADVLEDLQHVVDFDCPKSFEWDGELRPGTLRSSVHRAVVAGVPVLLVAPADRAACNIFRGDRIYGGSYNETEAYLYFCRAGLQAMQAMNLRVDILHLHEWQCSAAAMLYWDVFYNRGDWNARVLLTIHNLDNSGECKQDEFCATGVPGSMFADINKALDERTIGHNPERLNLLKGGIVYSNHVTTVSPTYAQEALTGGAAGFLRTLLNEPLVSSKFSGVLNGIDSDFWCPAADPLIPAPFNSAQPAGKALCKRFVQQGLGLNVAGDQPLVVCISRLVPQKGVHLIRGAIGHTVRSGGQFVLLGSGHSDGEFRAMAENELAGSKDARVLVMYSEPLAHMLYAAADFVLVPSLFEPCGLTQMIAMRYGAVPIVRRTGGLADTVTDVEDEAASGNGFVFDGADEGACNAAVDRAVAMFTKRHSAWEEVSRRNMDMDFSWREPANAYLGLYQGIRA